MAFIGVERAFQERSEDRRLNVSPTRIRRLNQKAELIASERKSFR
jgi:hypothetical protein